MSPREMFLPEKESWSRSEASSSRDCTALVACTLDGYIFPIEIEEEEGRIDPRSVAEALRQTCAT